MDSKSNIPTPTELQTREELQVREAEAEWSRLTTRQQNVMRILMEHPQMSKLEACKQAGYKVTKNSKVSGILDSISGKLGKTFKELLGYTQANFAIGLFESTQAEKIVAMKIPVITDGKITGYKIEVVSLGPDHAIRLNAWKWIGKCGEYEAPIKMDISHEHNIGEKTANISNLKEHIKFLEEQQNRKVVNAEFTVENESGGDRDLERQSKSIN